MKKVVSIVLSLVMLISVGMLSVPAFAAVGSQQSTTNPAVVHNKIIPEVNGTGSTDVTWEWVSDNPKQIKFTYNGTGTLTGWDFGTLKEGVDYRIVAQDGKTITIELLNPNYDADIIANAHVDTSTTQAEEEEEEEEEEETTASPAVVSTDTSSTSPKTGAAAAAGIAVMGAGVAILTALKKKED